MDEIRQLKERLEGERPAEWEDLPDLALYMDQLISYMSRQLIGFEDGDALTSAMVNNYIKEGLLPRAEGKRYGRVHLAYLTAICALKQVLSVKEVGTLLAIDVAEGDAPRLYELFRTVLDGALDHTAQALDGESRQKELTERELTALALELALEAYAHKLACQRVLAVLKERQGGEAAEAAQKKKKTKAPQER